VGGTATSTSPARPRRALRRLAVGLVLVVVAGCGRPDPAPTLDALTWPSGWELALATEDRDPSCGLIACPTAIHYFRVAEPPDEACDTGAATVGAEPVPHAGGCRLERCVDDVFLTVSVTDDAQRVQEGVDARLVEAPPGGAAVAVRARAGC
jgi:hypothetical protein